MIDKQELVTTFKNVGLKMGMVVEVYVSDNFIENVIGGSQSVVDAIIETIGYNGTILVPYYSYNNVDPSLWQKRNLDLSLLDDIRNNMPPYRKKESDLGVYHPLAINLHKRDGIIISSHPNRGFLAWGKYAKLLCNHQSNNFAFSQDSPLGRLLELRGSVLIIDGSIKDTSLIYLSEYNSDIKPIVINCAMNCIDDKAVFEKYLDIELDNNVFDEIEPVIKSKGYLKEKEIDKYSVKLVQANDLIEYSIKYLKQNSILNYYNRG